MTHVLLSRLDVDIATGIAGLDAVPGGAFIGIAPGGRRVAVSPLVRCGACDMCRAGLATHCRSRRVLGVAGSRGGIASHVTVSADAIVPLPDDLEDDRAVFAAPLAAAIEAIRPVELRGRAYVTVLGDSLVGLLAAQLLAPRATGVRLIGRSPERLALAERWGIRHRPVDEIGRRADQDAVVDCTARAAGLGVATQLLRPRGTVVRVGLLPAGEPPLPADILNRIVLGELRLVGSLGFPIAEAVATLARGDVDVLGLLSRRVRLDDAATALRLAGDPDVIAVLVG